MATEIRRRRGKQVLAIVTLLMVGSGGWLLFGSTAGAADNTSPTAYPNPTNNTSPTASSHH